MKGHLQKDSLCCDGSTVKECASCVGVCSSLAVGSSMEHFCPPYVPFSDATQWFSPWVPPPSSSWFGRCCCQIDWPGPYGYERQFAEEEMATCAACVAEWRLHFRGASYHDLPCACNGCSQFRTGTPDALVASSEEESEEELEMELTEEMKAFLTQSARHRQSLGMVVVCVHHQDFLVYWDLARLADRCMLHG